MQKNPKYLERIRKGQVKFLEEAINLQDEFEVDIFKSSGSIQVRVSAKEEKNDLSC